jgi:SpoVK/Ycf46/Vps4 family AAA+-type ATPase
MVRELFVMAREHAPSIIFMDEIDSIGSTRIESGGGGDSEVQRTMLELLNQVPILPTVTIIGLRLFVTVTTNICNLHILHFCYF